MEWIQMDQNCSLKLATRQRFEMMPTIPHSPAISIDYQPCSLFPITQEFS